MISIGDAVATQASHEHLMTVDPEALDVAAQFFAASPGFDIFADEVSHPIVCDRCNSPAPSGWTRPRHGILCPACAILSGNHPDVVGSKASEVLIGLSSLLWVYVGTADSLTIVRANKTGSSWPKGAGSDPRVSLISCPSVAAQRLTVWHTQYDLLTTGHPTWTCFGTKKSVTSFATLTLSHDADHVTMVIPPGSKGWYTDFAGTSALVNLHDIIPVLDACVSMDSQDRGRLRTRIFSLLGHGDPWQALLAAKDLFPDARSLRRTITHESVMTHHVLCWMLLTGLQ